VKTRAEVVVIGGGFAGAATAYQLARAGVTDIVIVEAERTPGTHSSGRNAAMARFLVVRPDHLPLAVEGVRFLHRPPADFPHGTYVRRTGSMMLVQAEEREKMQHSIARWRDYGIPAEWLEPDEVEKRVPATAGATFAGAVYCADDGVADVSALLDGYLRVALGRGARLLTERRVTGIKVEAGQVCAVETEHECIETRAVVNACGAWAAEIASMAGACPMPFRSLRRHLVVTAPAAWVDPSWPFVWDVAHELYFRPEPPGLLLSPCDETEVPPGDVPVDHAALESLAEKIQRWMPRLCGVSVGHVWAGARTFTPDNNFVLGRDPRVGGFIWCAGLGGNGMAVSAAAGRLAAAGVFGKPSVPAHAPERFA
jgi:D-arginine dehydrogenase